MGTPRERKDHWVSLALSTQVLVFHRPQKLFVRKLVYFISTILTLHITPNTLFDHNII